MDCPWWKRILYFFIGRSCPDAPVPLEPPVVNKFRVRPHSIERGELVVVEWDVSGADKLVIEPLGGVKRHRAKRTHKPTEDTIYHLVAGNKDHVIERSREVNVRIPPIMTAYMPPWHDIKSQLFGTHGVAREGVLHLGTVELMYALKSLDDVLIWDGIRNPQAALANPNWTEYNGIPREEVVRRIDASGAKLRLLRRYFKHTLVSGQTVATGGALVEGTARADNYNRDIKLVVQAAVEASDLNGIRTLA